MSIAAGLDQVRARMADACGRSGRASGSVKLIAVSKGRSAGEIMDAYAVGQRAFGENRGAELDAKVGALPDDIEWHFVGSLQRRKVRLVRPAVSLLHSLDRNELASAWVKGPGSPPPVLVQVNVAGEIQKHGYPPGEVAAAIDFARSHGLVVSGLMTMPPVPETPDDSRRWFSRLRDLRDSLATPDVPLPHLSMGMTDDFEVAIEEGASLIRVGRAIFGPPITG